MKHSILVILACLSLVALLPAQTNQIPDTTPAISLFDSVEKVKAFLLKDAKAKFSNKYLERISLQCIDSHPKSGIAWEYLFAFKKPQVGGEVRILHYMDGEIIEFQHGP